MFDFLNFSVKIRFIIHLGYVLILLHETSGCNFFPTKKRLSFQNGPLIGDRSKISSSFVCLKMIKSLAKAGPKTEQNERIIPSLKLT